MNVWTVRLKEKVAVFGRCHDRGSIVNQFDILSLFFFRKLLVFPAKRREHKAVYIWRDVRLHFVTPEMSMELVSDVSSVPDVPELLNVTYI